MSYRLIRPLLFGLPPECSHRLAILALRLAGPLLPAPASAAGLARRIWGLRFPNPLGLAAGFDKAAEAAGHWHRLGFGFAELGTFTRLPQSGNPRPRLWRLPRHRALINRMGFNNPGAAEAARRLRRLKERGAWPPIPLGVNLGKSKDAPPGAEIEDYLAALEHFEGLADYIAVNVSSPNTPGLRSLQRSAFLRRLVAALARRIRRWPRRLPLLIKLAPDLTRRQLLDCCDAALSAGAQGFILTNTTLSRPGLGPGPYPEGGLSGAPLRDLSSRALTWVAGHTRGRVPLIASGGVLSYQDAARKLESGAWLVQIYTGLVYEGPGLPRRILSTMAGSKPVDNGSSRLHH